MQTIILTRCRCLLEWNKKKELTAATRSKENIVHIPKGEDFTFIPGIRTKSFLEAALDDGVFSPYVEGARVFQAEGSVWAKAWEWEHSGNWLAAVWCWEWETRLGLVCGGQGAQTWVYGWWGTTECFWDKTGLPTFIISKDKSVCSLSVSGTSLLSITSLPQNRVLLAAPLLFLSFTHLIHRPKEKVPQFLSDHITPLKIFYWLLPSMVSRADTAAVQHSGIQYGE